MIDEYNRQIDYLRLSVTDRCNFRCIYCMPETGVEFIEHNKILTYDEIIILCKIFKSIGINKIRLTGGEPLVRKDIQELIYALKNEVGMEDIPLTTNAFFLKEQMQDLYNAGARKFNISLDAINKSTLQKITRIQNIDNIFDGIDEAIKYREKYKDVTIKINTVPIKENKEEIIPLVRYAINKQIPIRFIELMPIGYGKNHETLLESEIVQIINTELSNEFGNLILDNDINLKEKCRYYKFDNNSNTSKNPNASYNPKIGFISSISHKFCKYCNRIRLTSTGFLKTCLQFDYGVDLKKLLNEGKSEEEIKKEIIKAISNKPLSHHFGENNDSNFTKEFIDEKKSMSQIGG
ncbi:MAG: GTP 3',8-cyclase MoaA [Eubacteriales bacterium]|nr:GTP 3',8-cyclase MoaA [Eubacteriales bacterium]